MVTAGDVRELLEERPDLEPAVEAVLEPEPPFAFDDLDLDSGAFGELVSRGVVERTDHGYRVADRGAVRRGMEDDTLFERDESGFEFPSFSFTPLELALLLGTVALVVAFRLVPLPTVYREGAVVLSSNDPYFYRYWVEGLLSNPDVTLKTLPRGVTLGEPLLVATLWLTTLALGGSLEDSGHVMAWYPVVSAAVTSLLVYAIAVVVTDDRRIGLASVAMLAVIPGHALRTSLGFADHHAFDYLWLGLTLFGVALAASAAVRREWWLSPRAAVAATIVAGGVAGQTLAWDNSPLLLGAVGLYLAADALQAVHGKASPLRSGGPVVAGVFGGAALVWLAHASLGWHTTLVASAPIFVAIGGAGVLAAGELVQRLDRSGALSDAETRPYLPVVLLSVLEVVGLLAGALLLRTIRPEYWDRLVTGVQGRLLADRAIAEVSGLFAQSGGWLTLLGFALFLAVPYLAWATFRSVDDGRWLPPVVYAWYFLVLSVVQVRFVGELAPALALFAGLGLVHLAERIDVARRPAPFTDSDPPDLRLPDRRQFGALVVLFLLVGSLGIVQVPVKTSQVTIPPAQSDAAFWMAEYSDERGLEYPSNYVFSEWGWSRMYNYFVSGESRSYGYAQSNFQAFVTSSDPAGWYDTLGSRRGFVVTTPDVVGNSDQIGTRLHEDNGDGLAHYRLLHVTGDGRYKVFAVVPGDVVRGTAEPNATVTATTTVEVAGTSFEYSRRTTADPNGTFAVRVAQPGEYRVADARVSVPESAVYNGSTVRGSG